MEEGLSALTKQLQSETALVSKLVENRFQFHGVPDEADRLVGAAQGVTAGKENSRTEENQKERSPRRIPSISSAIARSAERLESFEPEEKHASDSRVSRNGVLLPKHPDGDLVPFDPASAEGIDDTVGHFLGYFDQRKLVSHLDGAEDTGI